ncbi:hypothetical protein [Compostibacter hankyongensis]|uniref:DUF5010 domain-containing protein n=1 Tax=Compostibacter hankyongensis TaxID=1007089 RepID=A0ABP8G2N7_9BACT
MFKDNDLPVSRFRKAATALCFLLCCPVLLFSQTPENYSANLPATDALGRKLPGYKEAGPPRKDKFVGLFYWTWHTRPGRQNPPYDVSRILAEKPEAIRDYNDPIWPKTSSPFFWGEPLFGYYLDTDHWVLRKHAEMLADAGVDVIIFDCTNGDITWKESYMELCKVFSEARKDGIRTPQIAFMMGLFGQPESLKAMEKLYRDLYKPGLYKDLWFYWKGKPLIMAYPELLKPVPGDEAATQLHRDIRNFFTFRPGQPAYNKGPQRADDWGWLEIYPQHGYVKNPGGGFEQVTVGVAQNWSAERGLTAMNAPGAFGRSYTHAHGEIRTPGAVNHGYNFQEQWERALQLDPEFIFITGWNEWIAGRYKMWQQQANAFPDEFNEGFSRDVEPMKGGHGDDYYYQMVANIRRFKGVPPEPSASSPQTIAIDGNFAEWEKVRPEYRAHKGNTLHRNSAGWKGYHYSNTTGRNDIVGARVARDRDFLYFYVETAGALTPATDPAWMRLFIDTDRNKKTGWEGYDYVVNRRSPGRKAYVEKSGAGGSWSAAGEVDFAVKGNKLELKVPKKMLGITGAVDIEFKWSDNMQRPDIMDFWVNGDAAPAGRFNYHFAAE